MNFTMDKKNWHTLSLRPINLSDADLQWILLFYTAVMDHKENPAEYPDISQYIYVVMEPDTPFVRDPSAKFTYCVQSRDPMEKSDERHDAQSAFWILNSQESPKFPPPFENAYPINLCGARVEETKRHDEYECDKEPEENGRIHGGNILRYWSTIGYTGLLSNDDFLNALFQWELRDFDRSYSRYYNDYSWKPDKWKRCWGKYLKKLEICEGDGLSRGEISTFYDATRRINSIVFPKFLPNLVHPETSEFVQRLIGLEPGEEDSQEDSDSEEETDSEEEVGFVTADESSDEED